VPGTRQTAGRGEDALDERPAVVGATGRRGRDGAADIDEQHLDAVAETLAALDLGLLLLARGERERVEFELVVWHGCVRGT